MRDAKKRPTYDLTIVGSLAISGGAIMRDTLYVVGQRPKLDVERTRDGPIMFHLCGRGVLPCFLRLV